MNKPQFIQIIWRHSCAKTLEKLGADKPSQRPSAEWNRFADWAFTAGRFKLAKELLTIARQQKTWELLQKVADSMEREELNRS
jgi:predicted RecB family nuclease